MNVRRYGGTTWTAKASVSGRLAAEGEVRLRHCMLQVLVDQQQARLEAEALAAPMMPATARLDRWSMAACTVACRGRA